MSSRSTPGRSGFPIEKAPASQDKARRTAAWAAALLWLAAGLSAGHWMLLAAGWSPYTPLSVAALSAHQVDSAAVARALGASPQAARSDAAPVVAGTRYTLVGVVTGPAPDGAALIAVDGQPPRPYRVGASLEGGLILQAVSRRGARLGTSTDGPATLELRLPAPG